MKRASLSVTLGGLLLALTACESSPVASAPVADNELVCPELHAARGARFRRGLDPNVYVVYGCDRYGEYTCKEGGRGLVCNPYHPVAIRGPWACDEIEAYRAPSGAFIATGCGMVAEYDCQTDERGLRCVPLPPPAGGA
jgi:hypothetical protein